MSIFGPIVIGGRTGWRAEDARGLSPFDAQINMPPGVHSHGVRRRVAEPASKLAFDGVGEELSRRSAASLAKWQLEEFTRDVSKDFDAFYETQAAEPVDPDATLVGGVGATGAVMRPEALHEATRRAHEAEAQDADSEHWPKPKSTRDAQRNGTRMVGVSVVYEVAPYERITQDILRDLRPVDVAANYKQSRPRQQAKRVSASVIKSMRLVVRETLDEMKHRDPNHAKRWAPVVDGAEHQLDIIEAEAADRGVEIEIVLDFNYIAQYVWDAAKVLAPDDEAERRTWVAEKLTLVLRGESSMPRRRCVAARPAGQRAQAGRHMRRLPHQVRPLALRRRVARRPADHKRCRRGRVPPSGQRSTRHHRPPLGPRPSCACVPSDPAATSTTTSRSTDLELQRNRLSRHANGEPRSLARPGRPNLRLVT